MAGKKWIQNAISKPGRLRKALGVSKRTGKITVAKLNKAAKGKGGLGKAARLAKTLRSFHKKG